MFIASPGCSAWIGRPLFARDRRFGRYSTPNTGSLGHAELDRHHAALRGIGRGVVPVRHREIHAPGDGADDAFEHPDVVAMPGQEIVRTLAGVRLAGIPDFLGERALRRDGFAPHAHALRWPCRSRRRRSACTTATSSWTDCRASSPASRASRWRRSPACRRPPGVDRSQRNSVAARALRAKPNTSGVAAMPLIRLRRVISLTVLLLRFRKQQKNSSPPPRCAELARRPGDGRV